MRPVKLRLRNQKGQDLVPILAWPSGVPGLLVHGALPPLPDGWTVSHRSGLRIGGFFSSKEDAMRATCEHLRSDVWRGSATEVRASIAAMALGLDFKGRFET